MRELFSYVVPDWIKKWLWRSCGEDYTVLFPVGGPIFFLVRPRVLWEELKRPRADCPAQSVVVRVAGAGGASGGWTALHGRCSAFGGLRNSAFLRI